MVSLKSKLLSSPLYLLSSMYIFVRFVNSLPKPQLNKVGYINGIGCTNKVGYRVNKVKVRVSVVVYGVGFSVVLVLVLVLVKLFLRRQLIQSKLNFFLITIYSLISSLVHSISSSSYRVLYSDLGTMVFLYYFTHTPLFHRNI